MKPAPFDYFDPRSVGEAVSLLREHASSLGIDELRPWDVAFVAESLRKARYEIDDEVLRPYFPLDNVLEGLFSLAGSVFGLKITEKRIREVWHPDVRYYEVSDERGVWIGSFYTDWFPRTEKRAGAWMNDFITGGPRADGSFAPHLGFISGNFSPQEGERPSLLTHREVQTVFHEFGHLMPISSLMMASPLTPDRRASEIKRPAASICEEAQPPVSDIS